MVVASIDVMVDALRETNLLRAEQNKQLISEIAPKYEDPQELAKHLVRLSWITLYQGKKLLNGHGQDLILGNYVILDKIGEGGMGKVFKAKQVRLNRVVALKVIRPDLLANEMALKRFRREAQSAAQLTHPNIVRLYDADQVGDRHFLAMEFVEGIDLAHLIKEQGRLSIATACSYIRQAATGLQHAHDLGLVHRDIKPGNLLVTAANSAAKTPGGVIKILDMGLARGVDGTDGDSALTALTQDGTVIGTPDFMSPEQAKNSSTVDGRSDLYSLGCTFYLFLVGHAPFRQGSTLEKLLQHQMDSPPHIQLLRNDVPNEVATIVHTLLAKLPEDRFQSGSALANALEPWSVFTSPPRTPVTAKDIRLGPVPPAAPIALPPPGAPAVPNDADLFDFEDLETSRPAPPKTAGKTEAMPPPASRRRKFAWIAAAAASLGLIIGGVIAARNSSKKSAAPPAEQTQAKDESRPAPKKDKEPPPPPRKTEQEPLDAFLPTDTELVAIVNVQQLGKSKFFADEIKPKFEAELDAFRTAASFDPLAAIERVIVAVPATGADQTVIVVQGYDFLTSDFLNWIGSLPGVQVAPARVPGHGMKDVYRLPPDKDKGGDTLFGAILSINPSCIVLSSSRDRVIDALARVGRKIDTKFDDPTIRPMLARYGQKSVAQPSQSPPTLWVGLGTHGKLFGFGSPKDGGVQTLIGAIRLGEGMDFDATLEASTRFEAVGAWAKITLFAKAAAAQKPIDKRTERIASLLSQAIPDKFPGPKSGPTVVGHWSHYIKPEQMSEWFAPFFEK